MWEIVLLMCNVLETPEDFLRELKLNFYTDSCILLNNRLVYTIYIIYNLYVYIYIDRGSQYSKLLNNF